jgi:mRNA-degrading endonuclease RelE of RelBE toxin-antitoxin system
MTPEQQQYVIDIYTEAITKIKALGIERQTIIKDYIKELENRKIELLKNSLNNTQR